MNHVTRDFSFMTVAEITAEWAGAARLEEILQRRSNTRCILLVADLGLIGVGILPLVLHSLQDTGFQVTVYDRVQPDPHEHFIRGAIQVARGSHCDMVIGLDGGSSLDVTKLVAVLINSEQKLPEFYRIGKAIGQRLPLVNIPTTTGTGSEVTNIAILTTHDDNKVGIVSPQLYGGLVLLDAQLTLGLPPIHTAAAGIDAIAHAIEACTGKHKKNPLSDALARKALRLISRHLVTACYDENDREARESVPLGAILAGQAFANSPVATVHALAYPLSARHRTPHELSNALMLIPVLQFNTSTTAPLYGELTAVIGVKVAGDVANDTQSFIAGMVKIIAAAGAPNRLRDVDIPGEDLLLLAHDAMQQTRLLDNNPVTFTENDALRLYQWAFQALQMSSEGTAGHDSLPATYLLQPNRHIESRWQYSIDSNDEYTCFISGQKR